MIMDFNIKLSNGQVLKGMIQSPGENTKAVIVFVHGLGEHIQRYDYWANYLKRRELDFSVLIFPVMAELGGRRGNIKSYCTP